MKGKLNCIMLIDDDEDDNFFHNRIIREASVTDHVQISETGFAALNFLRDTSSLPDLIFLDINMPRMNGWEFIDHFKKLSGPNIPSTIIMLTTSLNPADRERAKTIPQISDFMTKPLTREMLRDVMLRYFDNGAAG